MKLILGTMKILSPNEETSQGRNESRSHNKRDNRKTVKSTLNYDDEELLILSVQERRPLWDFTVPLEQRCQRLTKKLWEEVSETLGGKKTLKTFVIEIFKEKFHLQVNLAGKKPKKSLKIYMMPTDE